MSSERKRKGKETAADPKAPVPEKVTAVLDYGKKRPLCAPLQQKFGDLPILHFNVGSSTFLDEYIRVMDLTLTRAAAIAPATLLGHAITPIPNPCNRPKPYPKSWDFQDGNSHYIIEMRCTEEKNRVPIKRFGGMRVRILFCDYNGYQIGFSRYLNGNWSVWHYCSEQFPLPFFLRQGAIKLPFRGDYTMKPHIGGFETFLEIFQRFGNYPEEQDGNELEKAFLASAVVLCEARRIVWIYLEVKERIRRKQRPRPLDCNLPGKVRTEGVGWTEITDWGNDSADALVAVRNGEYIARSKDKGYAERARPLIETFGELVSQEEDSGHLRLLMRKDSVLAPKNSEFRIKLEKNVLKLGAQVVDPRFPLDPEPPEGIED